MPKAVCPACKTEVKYPREAGPGPELTCPECDEVFVPPELRAVAKGRKAYDPEEEETYRAERPIADPDRERKARLAAAASHHAARRARAEAAPKRRGWFD